MGGMPVVGDVPRMLGHKGHEGYRANEEGGGGVGQRHMLGKRAGQGRLARRHMTQPSTYNPLTACARCVGRRWKGAPLVS